MSTRDLVLSHMQLRAESVNEEERSVEAVLTTEQPVEVFDWSTGRIVDEVLVSGRGRFPKQTPLLENHSRFSLDDVVGSTRGFEQNNGEWLGRLFFAEGDERADRAWNKVRQGHLTDVSIGYRVREFKSVPPGKSAKIGEREYTAGNKELRVATSWEVKEVSLVPIGADDMAKIRAEAFGTPNKETKNEPTTTGLLAKTWAAQRRN